MVDGNRPETFSRSSVLAYGKCFHFPSSCYPLRRLVILLLLLTPTTLRNGPHYDLNRACFLWTRIAPSRIYFKMLRTFSSTVLMKNVICHWSFRHKVDFTYKMPLQNVNTGGSLVRFVLHAIWVLVWSLERRSKKVRFGAIKPRREVRIIATREDKKHILNRQEKTLTLLDRCPIVP